MRWKDFFQKKTIFVLTIILLFWGFMVYKLIMQEYYPDVSRIIESNYKQTLSALKSDQRTTMGIYYGVFHKSKIGYMQSTIEPREDGTFDVISSCRFTLPLTSSFLWDQFKVLFNIKDDKDAQKKLEIFLKSNVYVGPDYQIKEVALHLKSSFLEVSCEGKIRGNKLFLDIVKNNEEKISQDFTIPAGTMVTNPIGFSGRYPKLSVGKQIKTRWFDPVTQSFRISESNVLGKSELRWYGKKIPVYIVQSSFAGLKSTSWVNEEGEIYQYQFSFLLFIKELKDIKIETEK